MNLKNSSLLISLAVLITMSFIIGCGPQTSGRPIAGASTRRINYKPLVIPTVKPAPSKRVYPETKYIEGGSLNGITIIIDAGHGGKDPGAGEKTYSRTPEKTINLAIAKELQIRLKAKGAKVVMSRTNDSFIELDDRAAMPGIHNADLLVSIHADSCPNRYISGTTIYIAKGCSYKSRKAAQNIQSSFTNSNIKCRGIDNRDFRVLAKHSRPAVLVECGYMTNAYEAKALNNSWYRKKLATAIANGIANTF